MCRNPKEYTTRSLRKKRDTRTLAGNEVASTNWDRAGATKEHTQKGQRERWGTGLGWGQVRGSETMPKRRANFESMTPLNAVFWFHYALPGSIYQRAGDGQQVAMPRPLAAAATVCLPSATCRLPLPASHTLLVACNLGQGIPKK